MSDALPYTDELVAKLGQTIATYQSTYGPGIESRRLCTGLLNNGIGLVEITRRSSLVDLGVYHNVLERMYAAEALAGIGHVEGSNPVLERMRKAEALVAELEAEVDRLKSTAGLPQGEDDA